MTADRKPPPPADLADRGRVFWRRTLDDFDLSRVELELLVECCRTIDECESLRTVVELDGPSVAGASGQVRVHPAIGELRSHRLALGRLLAQLDLPDVDGVALSTPRQAAARSAARARWGTAGGLRGVENGTA